MNLIEQYAKLPPLPCLRCEDAELCDPEMRRTCPSMLRRRGCQQEAYRRHLMWMVRSLEWKGCGNEDRHE